MRPRGFVADPFGVVAGGDQQDRGGIDTNTVTGEQRGCGLGDELAEHDVEGVHVVADRECASTEGPHREFRRAQDRVTGPGAERGRASGEVLAYLNADEQYLPGALKQVHDFFAVHPSVDVLLSDTVVTDSAGDYICHRYSLVPKKNQMWVRFPALTCALFLRRRVVFEAGIRFDTRWRALGDWFWVKAMIDHGLQFAILPELTSVFTDTGENMMFKPHARQEQRDKWQMAPAWVRLLKYAMIAWYRVRLGARGAFSTRPFDYSLYTLATPSQRVIRHASKPTSFWKGRLGQVFGPTAGEG